MSWAAVAPDKKQAAVLLAQRLCTAAPPADYLTVPGLKSEARYRVVAVPQQVAVARFGGLVKHIAPVKLSTDGLVLRTVNRHYALPDGSFTAMASGAALASGIPLNDQFLEQATIKICAFGGILVPSYIWSSNSAKMRRITPNE
ncbi:MAG: GH36 C-terminal domain-containing protein [Angelakisella sp.]